ncbi:pantothenate synthetase [Armatimonadetes bacterium GBS]|jgi:pantoate--beta-alanine ligase|nr:pantothenate synthetase [Armatimonadetes bacterium GBS]
MQILKTIAEVRQWVQECRRAGEAVHFVPTMGYFHEGHLSLMRRAKADGGRVIVSLFVNPLQFGPQEDFERYPRDFERDRAMAESVGVDAMFVPEASEMYPPDFQTQVRVQRLSQPLCGRSRPGHFEGVATVVLKLFHIVTPDRAYFGEKDYQQLRIIQQLVRDLNLTVEIVPCPIVREPDGLAMSSRNVYLTPEERAAATVLYRSLQWAQEQVAQGMRDAHALREQVQAQIAASPYARIDYVEIVDAETLEPLEVIDRPARIAVAAYFGKARLIDNMALTPPAQR